GATADVALTANADMTCDFVWYRNDLIPNVGTTASALTAPLSNTGVAASLNPYYYTVVVTNANGCVTTSAPYEVSVVENPTVTINASETTVCAGGEITLTSYVGNILPENVNYSWMLGVVNVGTQPNLTLSNLTVGDYTYTLNVETVGGCIGTANITIHVVADPTLTVTPNTPTTLCSGSTVDLGASITAGGVAGGEVYTWQRNGVTVYGATGNSFTDELTNTNINNIQYLYTATVEQAASGCAATANSAAVTVLAAPAVSISGNSVVCSGTNVSLTANVPGGATYIWFLDGVNVGADAAYSASHSQRTAPYVFTLQVTSGGCTMVSEPYNVYVNSNPQLVVTADDINYCAGGQVTLTANVGAVDSEDITYNWSPAGGTAIGNTLLTPALSDATYTYSVTATSNGCQATGSITLTRADAPTILATTLADADIYFLCDGGNVKLTCVPATDNYIWQHNGVVLEGVTGSQLIESLSQGTHNFTISNHPGCLASVDIPVSVQPTVFLGIGGSTEICEGGTVTFEVQFTDPNYYFENTYNNNNNYNNWYEDNRLMVLDPDNTWQIDVHPTAANQGHTYQYLLVDEDRGCYATSEVITIDVHPRPTVTLTPEMSPVCAGAEITLFTNISGYQSENPVYKLNGVITTLNPTVTINDDTTFTFELVASTAPSCDVNASVDITVTDPIETPAVTINSLDATTWTALPEELVCNHGQVLVSADFAGGARPDYQYAWYKNGILMEGNTASSFIDELSNLGDEPTTCAYTVVVSSTIAGCENITATSVNVRILPDLNMIISGPTDLCAGSNAQYIATCNDFPEAAMFLGGADYTWYVDDIEFLDETASFTAPASEIAPQADPYTYRIHAVADFTTLGIPGCSVIGSQTINLRVSPQPVVTITNLDTTICEGGQITLSTNIWENNVPNLAYRWYTTSVDPINIIPGEMYSQLTVSPSDTTKYYVEAYQYFNEDPLVTSSCRAFDTVTVNVVDAPVITAIQITQDTVCEGTQVRISAVSNSAAVGNDNYTWYRNGVVLAGITDSTFTDILSAGSGITQYIYTAVLSQPSSGCISINNPSDTVYVQSAPTVAISGDAIVCTGTNIQLTANLNDTIPGVTYNYQWRLNNQNVATGKLYNVSHTPNNNPYVFTVFVSAANACSVLSAPFEVLVNDNPTVVVTAT
ncbi:MAG TPA: hypothetical protein PKH58_11980, partial [Paludibacteraceae bacterium]|nr:hypothetical protein [Paludibacteraceae bacterium]